MKDRPIIFNAEMVRAVLDGRKTVTRRPVKPQPDSYGHYDPAIGHRFRGGPGNTQCPLGQPGDQLWVRETWQASLQLSWGEGHSGPTVEYRADGVSRKIRGDYSLRAQARPTMWRPSIHMPRWASRITLEVTAVRVERVQDISAPDANREGVSISVDAIRTEPSWYVSAFRDVWNSIYSAKGLGWAENPFVWVVEFKVLP